MRYLLTLDVGTTAVKAGLFTEQFESMAFAIEEYTLLSPQADFVEMKPDSYWEKMKIAIEKVISKTKIDKTDVIAITCTTQGETLIPVGKDGQPLSNAIVWLDARAKEEAEFISNHFDKMAVYAITGLPEINGYCPVAKILWMKNNLPDLYQATDKFLLLEDYLIYRLSGRYLTNPSLICSTGYFNINTDALWDEMLAYCDIPTSKFPEILPSGKIVGSILPEAARELSLSPDTVVTTGAMDQVASAIGSGNITVGTITETTGTAQVVAATCEKIVLKEFSQVTIYRHAVEDKFLKIVINQTAGIAYKWFRDEFCLDLVSAEGNAFDLMGDLAAEEPALSRGLTFFPHLTGMQFPQSDESLRGVFFGVGLDTNRGCFIRSIMEGVGYMLRESIEAMELYPDAIISLGGGAKSQLWTQIKADICNIKIAMLENDESTSLGAAVIGGVAVGVFKDYEEARNQIERKREFVPNIENNQIYEKGYAEYKEMYPAFSQIFQKRR